jgi:hypothetical protein
MMLRVSTTIGRVLLGAIGFFAGAALFGTGSAVAWTTGTGPRGGTVAVGPRGAVGVGPQGGAAAVGRGGRAAAAGPYGGAAVAGPRRTAAVGPYGGAAAVGRPGYPAYRPPVAATPAVQVYPGYVHPVAPVGAAVAAGVVAGATAGAIAGAAASPPPVVMAPAPTGTVVAAPPPPGGELAMGATLVVLPAGCTTQRAGSVTYYRCGPAWLRPYMQGPDVVYLVVPAP